jgi:hypothetical protein
LEEEIDKKGSIFGTGEAIDKAGIEDKIIKTGGRIDSEDADRLKTLDSVFKEAKDFYKKNYQESLLDLDQESSQNPWYYEFAYVKHPYKRIEKTIESGEVLDGARDILPMAIKSAKNKVSNAQALKVGTVTEIVDIIGTGGIEEMESFEKVKNEFDLTVNNEKKSFDDLYDSFKKTLHIFQEDLSRIDEKTQKSIFSPENNAIISALAKILKEEGIENESVTFMSEKFEEYLESLINKNEKIESTSNETPRESLEVESSKLETQNVVLEQKEEEPAESATVPPAMDTTTTRETPIEGAKTEGEIIGSPIQDKETGTTEENTQSLTVPELPQDTPVGKVTESSPTIEASTNISTEAKQEVSRLIESFFPGDSLTVSEPISAPVKLEQQGTESQKGDRQSDMIDSIFGAGTSSWIFGKEGGQSSEVNEKVTGLSEKISPPGETLKSVGSIKETGVQKLISPILPTVDKSNTETTQEMESSVSSVSQKESSSGTESEKEPTTEKAETQKTAEDSVDKTESKMEEKLDLMINLLSQLNDTLQNPLIVTSTNKNF